MTRSEDPPGQTKHLRFGKISDEALDALIGYPGTKAVVLHTHGKSGEHPHWHVWWIGDKPVTNQTVRNQLKKLPAFEGYSGQNDWSFRNHDSFPTWADYVTSNLSHKVLLDYDDLATRASKASLLSKSVATPAVIPGPRYVKAPSRMRWDEKMCLDAETRLSWKRDSQFSLTSMEEGLAQKAVQKQVIQFMNARVNNNECIKYARNLLYVFGDEDVKEYVERRIWDNFVWI